MTSLSIRCRPMYREDIETIYRLETLLHPTPWKRSHFIEALSLPRYACHVAFHQDKVIGYIVASHGIDVTDLQTLGIDPAFQRQSVATTLLNRLAKLVTLRGNDGIFLEVRESNEGAIAFYQKIGFTPIGQRKGYYQTPSYQEDAITMLWDLKRVDCGQKTVIKGFRYLTAMATE